MKLEIMTRCGSLSATGVDGEAVEAFLDAYEDGDSAVLRVPDGSPTRTLLIDRDSITYVDADEDAPEPPEPVEAGAADDGDTGEESSTQ